MKLMKLTSLLFLVTCLGAFAETEEHTSKRFPTQPGGTLDIAVDFLRKVTRATKADEEAYLEERPVAFSQDGNTLTIYSRAKNPARPSRGNQRTEGKYIVTVPAVFGTRLKTDGGAVAVSDLT